MTVETDHWHLCQEKFLWRAQWWRASATLSENPPQWPQFRWLPPANDCTGVQSGTFLMTGFGSATPHSSGRDFHRTALPDEGLPIHHSFLSKESHLHLALGASPWRLLLLPLYTSPGSPQISCMSNHIMVPASQRTPAGTTVFLQKRIWNSLHRHQQYNKRFKIGMANWGKGKQSAESRMELKGV